MWLCLLFVLVISTNCWADPIAIGTGTVTLNSGNVTYHDVDSWVEASGYKNGIISTWEYANGRECLYLYGGNGNSKAYWDVTIQSGNYDVEMHYGTAMYGITAKFNIIDPSNSGELTLLYDQPYQGGPVNQTISDNFSLTTNGTKTYRVQAINMYPGGGSHFVVEYIKFTRTDGCASPETASFVAGSGDVTGSVDDVEICASAEFTMPSSGSMVYPGYMFTGWKLNNTGDLITAGTSYTMPAGGASFTAQWAVDNVSLRVPSVHPTLSASNYSRTTGSVVENGYDVDGDEGLDTYLNLQSKKYAEWDVYLEPGTYNITVKSCVDVYGIDVTYTLYDPAGVDATQTIHTYHKTGTGSTIRNVTTVTKDLSSLTANKRYVVKVEDTWEGGCHLRVKDITFTKLGANYAISFAKGDESVTGSLPANTTCAEGGTYTLPSKGNLALTGNTFTGWSDGSNTYAAGSSYIMPNHDVTFTAQWESFTVPTISNLAITNAANSVIPLSWDIPGICDLSRAVEPLVTPTSDYGAGEFYVDQQNYNDEGNYISVVGKSVQWSQYGAAFNIPATTDLEWISYEFKGNYSDISIWGGVCDNNNAYWKYSTLKNLNDANNWILSGEEVPDHIYWEGDMGGAITSKTISQVAIYANAGSGTYDNVPFSVRNVRYHIADKEDIHHVVVMRKPDAIPNDTTDGTKIYSGTKSKFTDSEDKTPGTTYYYTVFAVHADGTLSEAVSIQHKIEVVPTYTVTYDIDGASGTTPTAAREYAATESFSLPQQGDLHKSGHKFAGWNDGSTTYAPGVSYTMPDPGAPVSFTAVWTPFTVPTVTNLAVGEANSVIPLSWDIPGICDLSRVVSAYDISDQFKGSLTTSVTDLYNPSDSTITAVGSANAYDQYGIAFSIPTTKDIETVTAKWKKNSGNIKLFASVINSTTQYTYWGMNDGFDTSDSWNTKTSTIDTKYWSNNAGGYDKSSTDIDYLGVFANDGGGSGYTNASFSLKELRYHIAGQEDIDHVVLIRKEGSAPENATDGIVLYSGTKSHYVDNEIKPTGTYYYTVFAVHADGTLSSGETVFAAYENPYKTHTRTGLTVGDYGTICLPYAVAAEDIHGADIFDMQGWPAGSVAVVLNEVDNMEAGRPYVFQATAATATFRYYAEGDETEAGEHNGLIGSYTKQEIPIYANNYMVYNNKLYYVDVLSYVGVNKAYINRNLAEAAAEPVAPAPGKRQIRLFLDGEQVITDIDQINDPAQMTKYIENGHLFIFREGKLYNAQGQLVK